jgi:hypothetical protein
MASLQRQSFADETDAELAADAAPAPAATLARLQAILAAHHGLHAWRASQLFPRISAHPGDAVPVVTADERLREALTATLRLGVDRGEVRPEADLSAFLDTLLAIYVWNYRELGQAAAGRLDALMEHQTRLMFEGVAARA